MVGGITARRAGRFTRGRLTNSTSARARDGRLTCHSSPAIVRLHESPQSREGPRWIAGFDSLSIGEGRMASPHREEIAHHYGFNSFAELLDVSRALPMMPDENVQSYVAEHPNGYWFVWEDLLANPPLGDPGDWIA